MSPSWAYFTICTSFNSRHSVYLASEMLLKFQEEYRLIFVLSTYCNLVSMQNAFEIVCNLVETPS